MNVESESLFIERMGSVMRAKYSLLLALLLPVFVFPACAHRGRCCVPAAGSTPLESFLPMVERGSTVPDAAGVGSVADVDQALGHGAPELHYFALDSQTCQCRAAANSTLGNLFKSERRKVWKTAGKHHKHGDIAKLDVLTAAELEARNNSAATALKLYYGLASGEFKLSLSRRGLAEFRDIDKKLGELRRRGVQIPFDASDFQRQQTNLEMNQVELELEIMQANFQLRKLLGLDSQDVGARIWPTDPMIVDIQPMDATAEVQIGLATRPEIRLLRGLNQTLDMHSLMALRQMFGGVNGLLGTSDSKTCKLKVVFSHPLKDKHNELAERRGQLARYTSQREQELSAEIQESVATIEYRLREIALAKALVDEWQHRLGDLEKERASGKSSFVDITGARLKLLDAQGALVKSIASWKAALVQLKELQGRLIDECGGLCVTALPTVVDGGMIESAPPDVAPQKSEEVPAPQPPLETDASRARGLQPQPVTPVEGPVAPIESKVPESQPLETYGSREGVVRRVLFSGNILR
jgi:hypothetical protein